MFRLLPKLPSHSLSAKVSGFGDESSDAAKLGRAADVMKGHGIFVGKREKLGGGRWKRKRERERGWRSSNRSLTLLEYIKVTISGDDTARPRALQRPLFRGVADRIKRRDNSPTSCFLRDGKIVAEKLPYFRAGDTSVSVGMAVLTRTKLARQQRLRRPSEIYARPLYARFACWAWLNLFAGLLVSLIRKHAKADHRN